MSKNFPDLNIPDLVEITNGELCPFPDWLISYFSGTALDVINLRTNLPWFWAWNDITTNEETIIKPWETLKIEVRINLDNFRWLEISEISWSLLKVLNISTRSCYAQSWVWVFYSRLNDLTEEDIDKINNWEDIETYITLANYWLAIITIPKWEWLFRFFNINRIKNTLRWTDLYNSVLSWEITIDWSYWETWYLIDRDWNKLNQNNIQLAERLFLPLNPTLFLPKTDTPTIVKSKKDLWNVLVEWSNIPKDFNWFEIWETVEVRLWSNITCVIEEWFYEDWSHHIRSPLIDPLFHWPIRTEIVRDFNSKLPRWIELMVIKK